jgi:hypothetical protein
MARREFAAAAAAAAVGNLLSTIVRRWFFEASAELQANKTAALKSSFDACVKNGTRGLFMVDGASFFGEHSDALANPTVGGCHPNDLGTADVASFWSKFLPTIVKD